MNTATETPNLNLDTIFKKEREKVTQEKLERKRREDEEVRRKVSREQERVGEVRRMLFELNEALRLAIAHSEKVRGTISALGNELVDTYVIGGHGLALLEISLPEAKVLKLCVVNVEERHPFIAYYLGYGQGNTYYQLEDDRMYIVPEQADEELATLTEQGGLVRVIARKSYRP